MKPTLARNRASGLWEIQIAGTYTTFESFDDAITWLTTRTPRTPPRWRETPPTIDEWREFNATARRPLTADPIGHNPHRRTVDAQNSRVFKGSHIHHTPPKPEAIPA